ncbi:hypothetical protein ACMFMF_008755 [Clarireedia jacksonii]
MSTIPAFVKTLIRVEMRDGATKGLNEPYDVARSIPLALIVSESYIYLGVRVLDCQHLSYRRFVDAVSEVFNLPIDEDAVEFGYVNEAPCPNATPDYFVINNDLSFRNAVGVLRSSTKSISLPLFFFTPKPHIPLRPARISPPGLSKPADLGSCASSTEPIDPPQINDRQPSCSPIDGEHLPQPLTTSESAAENAPEKMFTSSKMYTPVAKRMKMLDSFAEPAASSSSKAINENTALAVKLFNRYAIAQERVINMANTQATVACYIASLKNHLEKGAVPTKNQLTRMCTDLEKALQGGNGEYISDVAAAEEIKNRADVDKILEDISVTYPNIVMLMKSGIDIGSGFGSGVRFWEGDEETATAVLADSQKSIPQTPSLIPEARPQEQSESEVE